MRPGVRKTRARARAYTAAQAASRALAKQGQLVSLIKNVAGGMSETKRTVWYGAATPNFPNGETGRIADTGWSTQNQFISTNSTDIKRLIPYVLQGVQDNQRVGNQIKPVALNLRGRVALTIAPPQATLGGTDIIAFMYILQHKVAKAYNVLAASNVFTELLETGENTTKRFDGETWDSQLVVNDKYYQVIKKKKIVLRWAGVGPVATGATGVSFSANSQNYAANFTAKLKKNIPKVLKYPEAQGGQYDNDPTNSSLFFCIGFIPYAGQRASSLASPLLQLQYTSELLYKDA